MAFEIFSTVSLENIKECVVLWKFFTKTSANREN